MNQKATNVNESTDQGFNYIYAELEWNILFK